MQNNEQGVNDLVIIRQDDRMMLELPESGMVLKEHVTAKGVVTGQKTREMEVKFTAKEIAEGKGMVGIGQDGKPVLYSKVRVIVSEWDAETIREKRDKTTFRAIVATLKKHTGLVTKSTKGEPITVKDEDKIGFGDVVRWREGELDRLPGVRFKYRELPEETKERIHKEVVTPLEKKFNKGPKFSAAGKDQLMSAMLKKLAEAGIIQQPNIADAAELFGVKPVEEKKDAE